MTRFVEVTTVGPHSDTVYINAIQVKWIQQSHSSADECYVFFENRHRVDVAMSAAAFVQAIGVL